MAPPDLDRHSLVRDAHGRAVLEAILKHGPVTRVQVASITGLSKPTVNQQVRDLEWRGLVRENGRTTATVGRSAGLYEVDRRLAHVVAVDLGGTKVRVAVADLFGDIVAERVLPTTGEGGAAIIDQIVRLAREVATEAGVDWAAVEVLSVGTPGVFDPTRDRVSHATNVTGLSDIELGRALADAARTTVHLENDVNAAALGEQWHGRAVDCEDFVFIAVGTGLGMGVVTGGKLLHGSRGAAGEIAYLPIGGDPFDPANLSRGTLEMVASGSGIRELAARLRRGRSRTSILAANPTVEQVFAAAERDDPVATEVVDEVARLLAQAVVAITAVVDPQLVVFGGGIGSRRDLIDAVREHVAGAIPWPIEITVSSLGERAALHGALRAAVDTAQRNLFTLDDAEDG